MRGNWNRVYEFNVKYHCIFQTRFKTHFRLTRETYEMFTHEIVPIGRTPLGNGSEPAPIPPTKQVLYAFLWSMAHQEPPREVAARFDIKLSSVCVDRVLKWVSQAAVDLSGLNVECQWQNIKTKGQICSVAGVAGVAAMLTMSIQASEKLGRAGMVEWNRIFRLFRFSGILGQPREVHPKFRNELPENFLSIRSPTRKFRSFWANGKRPRDCTKANPPDKLYGWSHKLVTFSKIATKVSPCPKTTFLCFLK